MISFHNISPEEFFRLNQDKIPQELEEHFYQLQVKINNIEKELEVEQRGNELAWEQVSFARDLIEQIDKFSKENLSKAKLKVYNQIRENSYFEV